MRRRISSFHQMMKKGWRKPQLWVTVFSNSRTNEFAKPGNASVQRSCPARDGTHRGRGKPMKTMLKLALLAGAAWSAAATTAIAQDA
ncbi:MAG TPA: hypothetical protein VNZ85_07685, partial [Caulobacter sp.]|nr:hypothetical protein [Caulobacter sp.]